MNNYLVMWRCLDIDYLETNAHETKVFKAKNFSEAEKKAQHHCRLISFKIVQITKLTIV